jgi:thymidylate kinase
MQTIVILDGADNTGKTNIGKALSFVIGVPYFKNKDEHRYFLKDPEYFIHAIRYVDTYFTSYLETSGASIILDRAWPSEWIYSQALGRKTDMQVLRDLDDRHAALGTNIVIPYRTDYSSFKDDYQQVNDNIQRIHDLYMEFAGWTKCKCLKLNVDDENLNREIFEIKEFISSETRAL